MAGVARVRASDSHTDLVPTESRTQSATVHSLKRYYESYDIHTIGSYISAVGIGFYQNIISDVKCFFHISFCF